MIIEQYMYEILFYTINTFRYNIEPFLVFICTVLIETIIVGARYV